MLTPAEIFYKVSDHLLTQLTRSNIGGQCRYRGSKGLKCAIGCLIENDEYDGSMEGDSVGFLFNTYTFRNFDNSHENMLGDLQTIHDKTSVKEWPWGLENVRQRYHIPKREAFFD